jgi:AcrR family transcriptional regulator
MTGRVDPLIETLFRSTALPEDRSSAAPVRTTGTRARAGNAMNRTRAALLDGARRAVEESGTKITMAQVAAGAGVAKATLYNHFRTRDAVLAALLDDEVERLIEVARDAPDLPSALTAVAEALSGSWLLRTLTRLEPAKVAALARVELTAPGWRSAREAARERLDQAGVAGDGTVLRWVSSYLVTPGDRSSIAADVAVLIAGLPALHPAEAARTA